MWIIRIAHGIVFKLDKRRDHDCRFGMVVRKALYIKCLIVSPLIFGKILPAVMEQFRIRSWRKMLADIGAYGNVLVFGHAAEDFFGFLLGAGAEKKKLFEHLDPFIF